MSRESTRGSAKIEHAEAGGRFLTETEIVNEIKKISREPATQWAYIAQALAGVDTDEAWDLREEAVAKNAQPGELDLILSGVAGLNSKRAWNFRRKYMNDPLRIPGIAQSLIGVDTDEAWEMRTHLMELDNTHDKMYRQWIVESLAGLDSDRAWELRDAFMMEADVDKAYIAFSLRGLDDDRAWKMRDELIQDGVHVNAMLMSLIGLDSDRAWELRDSYFDAQADHNILAKSLAGLTSRRAWEMRERIFQRGNQMTKEYVVTGLAGIHSPRAAEMRHDPLVLMSQHARLMSLSGDYTTFQSWPRQQAA